MPDVQCPQPVSGLDSSFLSLETPTQPLQVLGVLELDTATMPGEYSFERFRDALSLRLRSVPEMREKLSDSVVNLGFPAWVPDEHFDIDRHVHRIAIGSSGAGIADVLAVLAAPPLDRHRPLWQMWVVEGAGTALTVLLKMHHAAADGVTFARFLSQLCSTQPDPPTAELVPTAPAAGRSQIAVYGLTRVVTWPVRLVTTVLPATVAALMDSARRARAGRAMAAPFSAPRTRFNARLSAQRSVAFARLGLGDVKKVKNHFGVTVNDVVTAVAGGAVRRYLLARGQLPEDSLVALVPSSVHKPSDRPARNQVSGMLTRLQTQIADPVDRLRAVAVANAIAKEHSSAIGPMLLQDWGEILGPMILRIAKRIYARLTRIRPMYNLVVSNVPGPDGHYLLGARITALYPFGPVMHGSGLNVTVWTFDETLHFGLIACPDLVDDVAEIADGLGAALGELLAAID